MVSDYPIKRIMDDEGKLVDEAYGSKLDSALVEKLFYHMSRIRTFDQKAISLQRQGRIGTYPPFGGQEAAQVGSALAMGDGDWIFPTYRDHGATLTYGVDMTRMFLYWNGRTEGCVPPAGKNIFPPAVPIASQIPHAVGASWAEKRKKTDRVAIAYFGDGATSQGDFHEGLNFASVFQTPTVFFNQNNGYAISVPFEKQTNSKTVAQKAAGFDMRSVRIDGNDCFAVYLETKKAVELARSGKGPTLIEAVTWRVGAHTTADDPSKYRPADKGSDIADPLSRIEQYMKTYGIWDEKKVSELKASLKNEVDQAIEAMEAYPQAKAEDMFDHIFAELPKQLLEQKETCLSLAVKND
ncbi:pyruvate dehydrogenase (acetyl-transferring) E1 component subunit alpha [Virgibacillus siamensis]|uniref:pyruvate dehydrogenase (acetyl-transferring) E1 component subunit alpha n=1 Tax=Virgibacillus siamensis TaxID=480071 RepID=UPI0009865705|nr:pyruvate dehydrogenase (acetyl-transferring) E1 component subunit alpha [Virgibacillus siamensis]